MKLEDCLPHLLHKFPNESDLIKAIEELSIKFTVQREDISDYLQDPRLVSAYTAFYLTTNVPKLEAISKWMPQEWWQKIKTLPLIDMGSGPGTFSMAWRELGASGPVFQWEKSAFMRQQARKLWDGFYPAAEMEQMLALRRMSQSLMLFGHSANEMGPDLSMKFIQEVAPEHVLFIEPGTKSFFPQMLKIRHSLLEQGYQVVYPCPSDHECPMAKTEADWCHQFIRVEHAPDVERLSQILKKDRRLLPLTVHAYSKSFKHQDKERIVRVHPSSKFSFEWDVCLGDEGIDHYQVLKRDFTKRVQKEINEVLAGASIESQVDKVLEQGKRVKLISINKSPLEP